MSFEFAEFSQFGEIESNHNSSISPASQNLGTTEASRRPKYRRQGSLPGYTGHYQNPNVRNKHELSIPLEKNVIRGYTGFRPFSRATIGEPSIPNEEKQRRTRRSGGFGSVSDVHHDDSVKNHTEGLNFNFRTFAKHMDTIERYNSAAQQLMDKGQSPEMLLRVVQAKMSERVNSYAVQLIRTRRLFELFDLNGDGVLDEGEFRTCLEKLNVQFDDVQALALFAYFDDNNDGFIEWEDFADHAMVHNPKGGTAVLPKMITTVSAGPAFSMKRMHTTN